MGAHTISFNSVLAAIALTLGLLGPAQAQQTSLDELYQQLLEADEDSHERIANRISAALEKSGSATVDLLLRRGHDALDAGELVAAVEHFTATIDHAPDFAAGYAGRAEAFFNLNMVGPALDDLRQVLTLEPRHVDAMFGVGIILEGLDRTDDAREVYRAITKVYPLDQDTLDALARVNLQLEGQAL